METVRPQYMAVAAAVSFNERNHGRFEKFIVNTGMVIDLNVNTGRLSMLSGETMWLGDDSLRMVENVLVGKEQEDEIGSGQDPVRHIRGGEDPGTVG